MARLIEELNGMRKMNEDVHLRIRDLEIENTSLEEQNRVLTATEVDHEEKFKILLERSVLMEGEIEQNNEQNQRLMDEVRGKCFFPFFL
jgi:hypothetical protein